MMDSYLRPEKLAKAEIQQAESLGHDCSQLQERLRAIPQEDLTQQQIAEAERIYQEALSLGLPEDYPYVEPSTLEEIRRQRPDTGAAPRGHSLCDAELLMRIQGGWLGRAAGCLAGKPVEGWSRLRIGQALKKLNAYPLDGYFPEVSPDEGAGYHGMPKHWTRGNITRAPRDDDTDYTILGLDLLETHGPGFTTEQVGTQWLLLLPFRMTYTAERIAYWNLVNGQAPPETAVHRNPYREWIGAQIRADAFGYALPGLPEAAAELAFRDAALSHMANGIYGEMWVAAMLSGAFTTDDVEAVIEIGLGQIPHNCRLADAIRLTVQWCKQEPDWEKVCDKVEENYGSLHAVHTINNACLVVMGLMKAQGDLGRGVCISVMGGWDTDCNGATVGSVLGVMLGADAIAAEWTDPLNDTLESAIFGFATNSISDLAQRTAAVSKRMMEAFGG